MKKTFTFVLFFSVITAFAAQAQSSARYKTYPENPFAVRFGLKAGSNFSNVILSPEPLNFVHGRTDFHAGIFAQVPISERFSLQPEVLYSRQGFSMGGSNLGKVSLHYLSVPLLLKINLTGSSTTGGLSAVMGPQLSYLANARVGVLNNLFSISYDGAFRKLDASLVGGLQYDLPGGLSLSGRYVYGLNNLNKDFNLGGDNARSLNDYLTLKNSVVQVSLGYTF